MTIRSTMVMCALAAMSGCAVYDSGGSDGPGQSSGRGGFLAVLSGWDDDGPVSGKIELEGEDADLSGTLRVRSGSGTASELDVSGSISGSSGELRWGDVSVPLDVAGDGFNGTYETPDGMFGSVAGARTDLDGGQALCGTYDGDDSGVWNFVVTDKGMLRGSFSGWASGTLEGSVADGHVTMNWSAPADEIGGTADGSIQSANASGSWTGPDVAGTWASDATVCP